MPTAAPHASVAPSLAAVLPQHVHKTDPVEVLLTGWAATGPDSHTVTARWPGAHPFYAPVGGLPDPLLVAETVRQAIPLLSHRAYDAPMDHRQSWSDFGFALDSPAYAAAARAGAEPRVELRIACSDAVRRGGRLCSLTLDAGIRLNGVPVGVARTTFANHSPAIYRRLRGPYADLQHATARALPPGAPLPAARTGRTHPRDVVLSATAHPRRTELRVDLGHRVLFDHPVDHIPGMLMLEAARQAAHAATHPRPMLLVGIDCQFSRYGELDAPCTLQTTPLPSRTPDRTCLLVTATQNNACSFATTVTLQPAPLP